MAGARTAKIRCNSSLSCGNTGAQHGARRRGPATQAGWRAEWCSSGRVLVLAPRHDPPCRITSLSSGQFESPRVMKIAPPWPAPPPPEPLTPDVGIDPAVEIGPTLIVPDVLLTPDEGVEPDVVTYPIRVARFFCTCLRPD